uniref:Probable 40S ribosomal protein S15 n=1 Tax=Melanopsichium pennsylvanicum 4 TaxID=1398559 RepID=A0A077RCC7_9BASI|nr:probable 40S ribosomal protein S15 [Melanopsichium pennsylvanicum 4]
MDVAKDKAAQLGFSNLVRSFGCNLRLQFAHSVTLLIKVDIGFRLVERTTEASLPIWNFGPNLRDWALLYNVDDYDAAAAAELKRKRTFRKFTYRGVELDALLDMSNEDFMSLVHARARRKFQRGLKRKPMGLIKRLRKAKAECQPNEKPATVKTHLRDMIIVPEMIGSMIGIYTGRFFVNTEIKPEMVGHYLGEFAMTYIPTRHGAKGKGATVDRFLPIR